MAMQAQQDIQKRIIEVNRQLLVETLEANRQIHVDEYEEAIDGYKAMALQKLEEAFIDAKVKLQKNFDKAKVQIAEFDPSKAGRKVNDYITLVEPIQVELKVPRNYSKEYDAAIDMANWDVRKTLELTHAEFQCFVRDEWDWSSDFFATSAIYKGGKL